MGLGSFLKKIALPAASIAAAPFTGGASLLANIGTAAKAVAPTLSSAAAGSAKQRIEEAPALAKAYEANLVGTKLGDQRAVLAQLLGSGGLHDVSIGRPAGSTIPTFSIAGGLRPSALGDTSALAKRFGTPIAPLQMPTAGTLEKVLGGVGLAGNILGALPKFGGSSPSASSGVFNPSQLPIGSTTPASRTNAGIFAPTNPVGASSTTGGPLANLPPVDFLHPLGETDIAGRPTGRPYNPYIMSAR